MSRGISNIPRANICEENHLPWPEPIIIKADNHIYLTENFHTLTGQR